MRAKLYQEVMEDYEVARILDFTDEISEVLYSNGSCENIENTTPNLPLHIQNTIPSKIPSSITTSLDPSSPSLDPSPSPYPTRTQPYPTRTQPHTPTPPLPNLIVVGDQSSGKSSLLCKLSNFPPSVLFPVSAGRCTTRCATKLILRTSSEQAWTAKVSTSSNPKSCKHVTGDMDDLRRVIERARSQVEGGVTNGVTTDSSIIIGEEITSQRKATTFLAFFLA